MTKRPLHHTISLNNQLDDGGCLAGAWGTVYDGEFVLRQGKLYC